MISLRFIRRPACLLTLSLFVAFLLLYSRMAAPGLEWGDAGEAQLAAWTGALSHPTGYPLFLSLGWLWGHTLAWVGVAPTRAMTLFSATAGAATVALVLPMMRALLRRARLRLGRGWTLLVATLAAVTFGLSQTFWSQALLAEVYTLNALFLVLLLWGLWRGPWGTGRLPWLALLLGLALGHHRLMWLWLPGLALWALMEMRGWRGALAPRLLLRLAALVLLPQLLYLYVPLRAPASAYLHQPLADGRVLELYDGSARAFLDHVSGAVFASNLLHAPLAARLARLAELWRENVGILSFFALFALFRSRSSAGEPLGLPLSDRLLLLSGALLTLLFGIVYGIGDFEVMLIPLWLVLIVLGYLGIALAGQRLAARSPRAAWLLAPLLVLVLGARLTFHPPSRAGVAAPRQSVERLIAAEPPSGAIIVSNDRDEVVPLWYAQFAEGQRPDLLALFPLVTTDEAHRTVSGVVEWALQWGRPVFLSKPMPGLALRYRLRPYAGPLVAVEGPAPIPSDPVLQSYLAPELTVVGWEPSQRRVLATETLTVSIGLQASAPLARDLSFSLQLFRADGAPFGQVEVPPDPFFPSSEWPLGEPLRLPVTFTLPEALPPALYEWRLSAYRIEGAEAVPVGQQVTLGRFLVGATPPPLALDELPADAVRFGGAIVLVGAVLPDQLRAGEPLDFLLRWSALDAPLVPYTLFVHLVNEAGEIVAQADAPPDPPTDTWVRGDTWGDARRLPLPGALPRGRYTLRVGLYDATGRLPLASGGDALDLATFDVP